MNPAEITSTIRSHILQEFLPGEDPSALTDTTPLVTTGILDSIAVLRLVTFLEGQFRITIEAHEADAQHLNTVGEIARLVQSKLGTA